MIIYDIYMIRELCFTEFHDLMTSYDIYLLQR